MGTRLFKGSYEELIKGNIEWLESETEHSVERMHIIHIMLESITAEYGGDEPYFKIYDRLMKTNSNASSEANTLKKTGKEKNNEQ